jgi:magnesium and cobalt transporter
MSSNPDPSSPAAHGAQPADDDPEAQRPGFFARLFGTGEPDADGQTQNGHSAPEAGRSGLEVPQFGMSNLRRMRVEDVAVPRAEIISVSCEADLATLVAVFRESGLTRLPVYEGTLDSPVGLVHLKDVALRFGFNGGSTAFSLRTMLRPLLYVPPSMPIGVLLQKMQTERTHMALVIDEYGGVDGLVTIEDLIEQVIGEIEDEHDIEEAQPWSREGSGAYLAFGAGAIGRVRARNWGRASRSGG